MKSHLYITLITSVAEHLVNFPVYPMTTGRLSITVWRSPGQALILPRILVHEENVSLFCWKMEWLASFPNRCWQCYLGLLLSCPP